jgi:hypothetical protein
MDKYGQIARICIIFKNYMTFGKFDYKWMIKFDQKCKIMVMGTKIILDFNKLNIFKA